MAVSGKSPRRGFRNWRDRHARSILQLMKITVATLLQTRRIFGRKLHLRCVLQNECYRVLQNERNPHKTGCSSDTAICYKPLRAVGRFRPAAVCRRFGSLDKSQHEKGVGMPAFNFHLPADPDEWLANIWRLLDEADQTWRFTKKGDKRPHYDVAKSVAKVVGAYGRLPVTAR